MKLKTILVTLMGALAMQGAIAGELWCPPAKDEVCVVDDCPDGGGYIGVEYMSDYIWRGVRLSRDAVAADVNYTFSGLGIEPTIGVRHVTSLSSPIPGAGPFGFSGISFDHTDLYAQVALPEMMGFEAVLRYDHYFYSNLRGPSPGAGFGSHGMLGLTLSKELFGGINASVTSAYDFGSPGAGIIPGIANIVGAPVPNSDNGSWLHTLHLSKTQCITDALALELSGGLVYSDNIWKNGSRSQRASGWNHYYLEAALPIALNCRATLSPYVGYNGTPDSWLADEAVTSGFGVSPNSFPVFGGNENDVLYWGFRFGVNF